MNLARANMTRRNNIHREGGAYACARFIEKKNFVVIFCWNVLIGPPGRRLYQKITNPSKMLASVKLMYYIGFN